MWAPIMLQPEGIARGREAGSLCTPQVALFSGQVQHLELVAAKKRDPVSHVSFLDVLQQGQGQERRAGGQGSQGPGSTPCTVFW